MALTLIEKYKQIAIQAAELQCSMRFKRLTRLAKDDKQQVWAMLDEPTKARLRELKQKYNGPVRYH